MRVFVSVQRIRDDRQRLLLDAVRNELGKLAIEPVMLADDFRPGINDPLPTIREAIASCQGAVVIACERLRIPAVTEYPNGPQAVEHADWRMPSVWNHIEGAMAFQAGLPVLVLREAALLRAGIMSGDVLSLRDVVIGPGSLRPQLPRIARALRTWCASLAPASPQAT